MLVEYIQIYKCLCIKGTNVDVVLQSSCSVSTFTTIITLNKQQQQQQQQHTTL